MIVCTDQIENILSMQDQLHILMLYDDPSDPIVTLLSNQQNNLHHEITLVSVKEFIEKMEICDELDIDGVNIRWSLKNNGGSTRVWNNHNTYLINRCYGLGEPCHSLFHPDDREYAKNEFIAYLSFAFNSFKYRLQPVNYYGLSGSTMPLFIQWNKVKGQIDGIQIPNYYVGPYHLLKWTKAIINSDPYDITYWRANDTNSDIGNDYVFAYERPPGEPVFIYITPIGADILKSESLSNTEIDEEFLKSTAIYIGKKIGISLGEVLLCVSNQQITFGAATPHIINAKNTPNFKELTLKALTTALSYDTNDHFLVANNTQRGAGSLIVIGSNQDRTTNNLTFSHAFQNKGILLPIEEFMTSWNFTYSDSKLKFFTKGQVIDSISTIYYRPFYQRENTNIFLELLNSCLHSFDGLVYGKSSSQYFNSSKSLQLANTISPISHYNSITFPRTIIIKK
jgi:hypothetical protein